LNFSASIGKLMQHRFMMHQLGLADADISARMLAIAKVRAAASGLQDIIEFKESDAENIDFPDSFFDAALCRWGLMLLPNLH
jgi:ubiquinone/menaquinone biosynthesis C-methylase UbiE